MPYINCVIFRFKKKKQGEPVIIDDCDWGWLVEDNELVEGLKSQKKEYKKKLSREETQKRFNLIKTKFLKDKENYKEFAKFHVDKFEMPDLNLGDKVKKDFKKYEELIQNPDVASVTFYRYWWHTSLH